MLLHCVLAYPHLLCELLGVSQQQVADRCRAYVHAHQQQQKTEPAAPLKPEEPPRASQTGRILPAPPPRRAVDPARKKEIRTRDARAQLIRDLAQAAGKDVDPAIATRHARASVETAMSLAKRVFEQRIVANVNVKWGDLTLQHLDSLEVNVPYLAEIRECLRELRDAGRLPDATTPLSDVLTPQEMEAIIARCDGKREDAVHALHQLRLARG